MKNVTLKTKLIGGFAATAVLTLVVGFNGWMGASRLTGHLHQIGKVNLEAIRQVGNVVEGFEAIGAVEARLLNPGLSREKREKLYAEMSRVAEDIQKARSAYETIPRTQEEDKLWKEFVPNFEALKKENEEFLQLCRQLDKTSLLNPLALRGLIEKFKGDHYRLTSQTALHIATHEHFEGGEDSTQCAFGKWMAGFKTENVKINDSIKEILSHHDLFHQSVKKIKGLVKDSDVQTAAAVLQKETIQAAERTFTQFNSISEEIALAEEIYSKMNGALGVIEQRHKETGALLGKIGDLNENAADASVNESGLDAAKTKWIALVGMGAGFALAMLIGVFLSLSISRALGRVIEGISVGAEQVASASTQVSGSSQHLAEGTSRQAASIEETSSSLEEMSSMTGQNAENAGQANKLMAETAHVVARANESMEQLTASMLDISRASEETSKIIRTIDEIAFQTNLLALNAAVEAARAGEAGAGFAVVADEVRNLAMRAAEAAKSTAGLIEDTVKKTKEGFDLVEQTSSEFSQVAGSAAKMGELVGEITAASLEQAQGIEQINRAVSDMDKVVQQNAANAEESASASEEMSAQARQMKDYVLELVRIVGSSSGGRAGQLVKGDRSGLSIG